MCVTERKRQNLHDVIIELVPKTWSLKINNASLKIYPGNRALMTLEPVETTFVDHIPDYETGVLGTRCQTMSRSIKAEAGYSGFVSVKCNGAVTWKLKWNELPKRRECAFGSHSQSLTNKLFFPFFFAFLPEPCVSLSWAWWKRYFFTNFRVFLTMQMHAQACIRWSKYTTVGVIDLHVGRCDDGSC